LSVFLGHSVVTFHWIIYHRRFNCAVFATAVNTKMEPGAMESILEQQQQQQGTIVSKDNTYADRFCTSHITVIL